MRGNKIRSKRSREEILMNHFVTLANEIPVIMAIAIVIGGTLIGSILVVTIKLSEPASKVAIVALILALSGWAMVFQGL